MSGGQACMERPAKGDSTSIIISTLPVKHWCFIGGYDRFENVRTTIKQQGDEIASYRFMLWQNDWKTVKTKGKGTKKQVHVMTIVILRGTIMIRFSYQLAAIFTGRSIYKYSNASAAGKL